MQALVRRKNRGTTMGTARKLINYTTSFAKEIYHVTIVQLRRFASG